MDLLKRKEREDLLGALLDRFMALVSAPCGFVWMVTGDGSFIAPHLLIGYESGIEWKPLQKGEGFAGKVWESGAPVVVGDYPTWPHRVINSPLQFFYAVAGFPLLDSKGAVVGVIGVADTRQHREFDRQEVHYLGQMAQLASIAMQYSGPVVDAPSP